MEGNDPVNMNLMRSFVKERKFRCSLYIHGVSKNFSFRSTHPTIYYVPVSSCFLVDIIPPDMNNIVFIDNSIMDLFDEKCSDIQVPINSNVMVLSGDWKNTIQIWDVYRPQPEDNLR